MSTIGLVGLYESSSVKRVPGKSSCFHTCMVTKEQGWHYIALGICTSINADTRMWNCSNATFQPGCGRVFYDLFL